MPPRIEPTPVTCPGIVDAVPDAVVVVDADGVVRLANARAETFFGSPGHGLLGVPADRLVPGLHPAVARMLAAGGADERLELGARRANGSEHPVEAWLARVDVAEGQMVAVSVRDDSERRTLREASARMRDELFASVSHELRTPLTSIIGYTELLVDMGEHAISEQAARLISVIERNAERELRLVEDLLTLSSLGASTLTVQATRTDLGPVAEQVVRHQAAAAREAGLELRCEAPEQVWVQGDAPRLQQVLRNLVGNAVKFTPQGGVVTVSVRAEDDHGVVLVEDQGVGVSADELPRLFEGLFRGTHAVAAHLPGAGLGLPIVKGIVDAHGGEVDVDSQHGEGTRVMVRIPLADPA